MLDESSELVPCAYVLAVERASGMGLELISASCTRKRVSYLFGVSVP